MKRTITLLSAAFAVSVAVCPPASGAAPNNGADAADAATPAKANKAAKPVRVKAPPRPSVKTNVSPGTFEFPRHRGNSPKFKPDRERDWVDPTGGKAPVKVPE